MFLSPSFLERFEALKSVVFYSPTFLFINYAC